jgi:hypothetical protein
MNYVRMKNVGIRADGHVYLVQAGVKNVIIFYANTFFVVPGVN